MENGQKERMIYCNHENEDDRCITGTWSIDELRAAFAFGYKLIDTTEVWSYDTERGEPQDMNRHNTMSYTELVAHANREERRQRDTPGFFTSYTNTFIRIKAEASGYPLNCESEAQKEEYIKNFYRENNVLLRKHKIVKNDTLYNIAKYFLNSLCGKLIQKEGTSYTILHNPSELQFFLNSDLHEIIDIYCCNDNYVVVNWKLKSDDDGNEVEPKPGFAKQSEKNVCITTGIQTTTNARLRLHSELNKLNERFFLYGHGQHNISPTK